jgi:hypothetical protein
VEFQSKDSQILHLTQPERRRRENKREKDGRRAQRAPANLHSEPPDLFRRYPGEMVTWFRETAETCIGTNVATLVPRAAKFDPPRRLASRHRRGPPLFAAVPSGGSLFRGTRRAHGKTYTPKSCFAACEESAGGVGRTHLVHKNGSMDHSRHGSFPGDFRLSAFPQIAYNSNVTGLPGPGPLAAESSGSRSLKGMP